MVKYMPYLIFNFFHVISRYSNEEQENARMHLEHLSKNADIHGTFSYYFRAHW